MRILLPIAVLCLTPACAGYDPILPVRILLPVAVLCLTPACAGYDSIYPSDDKWVPGYDPTREIPEVVDAPLGPDDDSDKEIDAFTAEDLLVSPTPENTAEVDAWRWVTVMNPAGVQNGNGEFLFDDTCGIKEGGSLTRVKELSSGLLVQYLAPEPAFGSLCSSGTLLVIDIDDFNSMIDRRRANQAERQAQIDEISGVIESL